MKTNLKQSGKMESVEYTRNQLILNQMKKETYTKREGIYAQLIINVLEEANKFDEKLSNVYVNHNIIEMILLNEDLSFCYDYFGRSTDEFNPKFIKACKKLNKQFSSDYPKAHLYTKDYKTCYYLSIGFGVRMFMRKVITKVTSNLKIEVKKQPFFVTLEKDKYDAKKIFFSLYMGKLYGKCVFDDEFNVDRKLKKAELIKFQNEIEKLINILENGDNEYELDDILDIVEEKLNAVA